MTWATNHDASLDALHLVQGSLKVELMMVPRSAFVTCTPDETALQVQARNQLKFSYFPVTNEDNRVIGLYHAERWFTEDAPDTPISNDFAPLSEEIVIGADASIFDFVMQADTYPTNLVVSGNQIAGLVSLSDLQTLPVRASLFALITSLEMAMALAIQKRFPQSEGWMSLLSEGRRQKLINGIAEAKAQDGFVSEIAFTQLSDKADIIRKAQLLSPNCGEVKERFKTIRDLRDNLAHANTYAVTSEAAKLVCKAVRVIYETKAELVEIIEK
ncbi:CBS domain-containing protein [Primorskyibacter flagellatus]|uniref:CBS domain-containing protein n=1 Tax=Primorskyibacter flagellatus TaxID=1387277 RepID=UPI003A8F38F5